MSGLINVLLILALVALVLLRQARPRRVPEGPRRLLLPVVALLLVAHEWAGSDLSGLVDPHHQVASTLLLATQLVIGLGTGVAWGMTTRVWQDESGTVWSRNTRVTAAVWAGSIALRVALALVGAAMGLQQGVWAVVLALGVALVVRGGVIAWRAGELRSAGMGRVAVKF
jgi:heme/copper-type cytochrome/quinol oxidase subunit 2